MSNHSNIAYAIQRIAEKNYTSPLRLVRGFVSECYPERGTIDFMSMDGTVSIQDVPVSSVHSNQKGVIYLPPVRSDVTILWQTSTGEASIVAYSHVDTVHIDGDREVHIGVSGKRADDEKDYDELETDGKRAASVYSSERIETTVTENDRGSRILIEKERIGTEINETRFEQSDSDIQMSAGGSSMRVSDSAAEIDSPQISLGKNASEPAVLGQQLVTLMRDFLVEVSKITTPTMLGTMPITNIAGFPPLIARLNNFLSQTVKVK